MPDIRTLLDEASLPGGTTPDPVGAVHRRVRRRAARRRAVVASGVTAAIAATAAAAVAWPTADDSVRPTGPDGQAGYETAWRSSDYMGGGLQYFNHDGTWQRLEILVNDHRDVFIGHNFATASAGTAVVGVALAGDADPRAWADEVRAAAGPGARVEQCPHPAARYDAIADEVLRAEFPSRLAATPDGSSWQVAWRFPCTVLAVFDAEPTAADHAYARDRWGGDVVVVRSGDEP